eukprot:Clim_evm3s37 gene=Clim_evmTU3s37
MDSSTRNRTLFSFKKLKVYAGSRQILHGVSGHVGEGELMAIMGPSGAGKSTLLSTLVGAANANLEYSGTIEAISGRDKQIVLDYEKRTDRLLGARKLRDCVGFVPQEDILVGSLTVEETIQFREWLYKIEPSQDEVNNLINSVGLSHAKDTIIGTVLRKGVSGGEKRRVSVAAEMASCAKTLILDEPTSGLDAATSYSLLLELRSLAQQKGLAVIVTIHQPSYDLFRLFDKLLLLTSGHVAFCGPLDECAEWMHDTLDITPPKGITLPEFYLDLVDPTLRQEKDSTQKQTDPDTEYLDIDSFHDQYPTPRTVIDAFNRSPYREINDTISLLQQSDDDSDYSGRDSLPTTSLSITSAGCEPVSWFRRFQILLWRQSVQATRDVVKFGLVICAYVVFLFIVGLLYHNVEVAMSQTFAYDGSIAWPVLLIYGAMLFRAPEIQELRIQTDSERRKGLYGPLAWFLPWLVITIVLVVVMVTSGLAITFWLLPSKNTASGFFATLLGNILVGIYSSALVFFCSGLTRNASFALVFAVTFLVFSVSINSFLHLPVNTSEVWQHIDKITVLGQAMPMIRQVSFSEQQFLCDTQILPDPTAPQGQTQYLCLSEFGGHFLEAFVGEDGQVYVEGDEVLSVLYLDDSSEIGLQTVYILLMSAGLLLGGLVLNDLFLRNQLLEVLPTLSGCRPRKRLPSLKKQSQQSETRQLTGLATTNNDDVTDMQSGDVEASQPPGSVNELKAWSDGCPSKNLDVINPLEAIEEITCIGCKYCQVPRRELVRVSVLDFPLKNHFRFEDISVSVTIKTKDGPEGSRKKKHEKKILKAVSGELFAGEVMAILGASGAGKSTLFNVLSGRKNGASYHNMDGSILLNGRAVSSEDLVYVEQFNLFYDILTIAETLEQTFALNKLKTDKLLRGFSSVKELLMDLKLLNAHNLRVGREASGGQRKRVAVGKFLNPGRKPVLFLDEPTTGLDSTTAYRLTSFIQRLAKEYGLCVIMTVHQPGSRVMGNFDRVAFLRKGEMEFCGQLEDLPTWMKDNGLQPAGHQSDEDYILSVLENPDRQLIRQVHLINQPPSPVASSPAATGCCWWLPDRRAVLILLKRQVISDFRDPGVFMARFVFFVMTAILVGLVDFGHGSDSGAQGISSFVSVSAIWMFLLAFSNILSVPAQSKLRRIIGSEILNNLYTPLELWVARLVSSVFQNVLLSAVFTLIALPMVGYNWATYGEIFLLSLLHACVTAAFVDAFSAIIPWDIVVMLVGVLYAGLLGAVTPWCLPTAILPGWLVWIQYALPSRYFVEGFLLVVSSGRTFTMAIPGGGVMTVSDTYVQEDIFSARSLTVPENMLVLFGMFVAGQLIVLVADTLKIQRQRL